MLKKNKKIIFLVLIALCFSTHILLIGADSGFDSNWDSNSSWDPGSSYSSTSDSYYSSDRDYHSSSDSNSNSSIFKSHDSLKGKSYFLVFCFIIVGIMVLFIVIQIVDKILQKKRNTNNMNLSYNFDEAFKMEIRKYIPDYEDDVYKNKFYNIYVDIQKAWMNFDKESIRNLTTDELYNMYSTQLDVLKEKKEQNIMSDFKLVSFRIKRITKENGILTVETNMKIEMYDYLINSDTKELLRGSDKHKICIKYAITFVKNDNINNEFKCPNCGKKIDNKTSGKCPYCDSEIVVLPNDFVMSKKENLGQRNL